LNLRITNKRHANDVKLTSREWCQ